MKQAPLWGGKSQTAPSSLYYAVTSQGGAKRNPGYRHWITLLYDCHRVDGVSVETDGIVVAMTFPGYHCIDGYVIPCRNAISVNAGLGQCSSTFLSPGLRFASPWAV
ncbi:MAG: hypothetical protein IKB16_01015 [Lentisphaeria bacterium]|nr:hypothetical protein [Lentisphaeria bacterium]